MGCCWHSGEIFKDEGDVERETEVEQYRGGGSLSRFLLVYNLAGRHSVRVRGGREGDGERHRERGAQVCVSGFALLRANALAKTLQRKKERGGEGE